MMIEVTDEELHFITSALDYMRLARVDFADKVSKRSFRMRNGRPPTTEDVSLAVSKANDVGRVYSRFRDLREKNKKQKRG